MELDEKLEEALSGKRIKEFEEMIAAKEERVTELETSLEGCEGNVRELEAALAAKIEELRLSGLAANESSASAQEKMMKRIAAALFGDPVKPVFMSWAKFFLTPSWNGFCSNSNVFF